MWISKYVTSQALFALCRWETLSVICYHLLVCIVICYIIVYLPFAPLHVRQKTIMNQCLWFLVSKSRLVVTLQHSECDKMIHFVYLHMRKGKQRTKINPGHIAHTFPQLSLAVAVHLCFPLPQHSAAHSAHSAGQSFTPVTLLASNQALGPHLPSLTASHAHCHILLCYARLTSTFPTLIDFLLWPTLPALVYHLAFLNFLTIFIASWASCLVPPCWYLSYISNCIKSCSSADCFRTEPY